MKVESNNDLILITGHRGMGVTAKPRSQYLKRAIFYPENSLAAFKEALGLYNRESLKTPADALECDIHVSKDGVAMVIHGNKLEDYADYIGSEDGVVRKTERTCNNFTCKEIQTDFVLKGPRIITFQLYKKSIKKLFEKNANQDFHIIPTLEQLLELFVTENTRRKNQGIPLIKLNIELKGQDSGFITIATINDFIKKQKSKLATNPLPEEQEYILNPDEIVLLGKMEVGEIRIAKNLIANKDALLNLTNYKDKEYKEKLSEYFGHREAGEYLTIPYLKVYYLPSMPREQEEAQLKSLLMKDEKSIVLTSDDQVFYINRKKILRKGVQERYTFDVQIEAYFKDKMSKLPADKVSRLDENNSLVQQHVLKFIDSDPEKLPREMFDIPQDQEVGKIVERIACYQYRKVLKNLLKIYAKDYCENNDFIDYIMLEHYINYELLKSENIEEITLKINKILSLYNSSAKSTSNNSKNHVIGHKEIIFCDFMSELKEGLLEKISTNIMLSSGNLYGSQALVSNEDFDIKPDVSSASPYGLELIKKCFVFNYSGIDISLFDFNEQIINLIKKFAENRSVIIGATASNWKGSVTENSPITPLQTILRSQIIASKMNVKMLLKVDEPIYFRSILAELGFISKSTKPRLEDGQHEGESTVIKTVKIKNNSLAEAARRVQAFIRMRRKGLQLPDSISDLVTESNEYIENHGIINCQVKPPRGGGKKPY